MIRTETITDKNILIASFRDNTDPEYVGPGTWNVIHRLAIRATTTPKQNEFISTMNEICNGFPCNVCNKHCKEYISTHPLEEYIGVVTEINNVKLLLGMFIWSWKFHNDVNARLNKPIMNWDTAYNLYSNTNSCSTECTNAK